MFFTLLLICGTYAEGQNAAAEAYAQMVKKPTPVSKTCEQCKGTGKVGDGRVFQDCLECNGDGKIDDGDPGFQFVALATGPETSYKAAYDKYATTGHNMFIMITGDNCGICKIDKATVIAPALFDGLFKTTVFYVMNESREVAIAAATRIAAKTGPRKLQPTYILFRHKKPVKVHVGQISAAQLREFILR